MSKLPIITLPDPLLRKTSAPIERVDDDLQRLIDNMLETMYAAPGIGLAAVQVGIPRRLIVLDVAERETAEDDNATASDDAEDIPPVRDPIIMINPEIFELSSARATYDEGCLSLPEVRVDIERPSTVQVRYLDRSGAEQRLSASGLQATVIQHEIDHLNGKLIIDYLSRLKRDIIVRKFRKQARSEP